MKANTTYIYRVKASNDDPDHYSNTTSIQTGLIYCTPTALDSNCLALDGVGSGIYIFELDGNNGEQVNDTSDCAIFTVMNGVIPGLNMSANTNYARGTR